MPTPKKLRLRERPPRGWIEPGLYRKILAAVPVPCVDAVIVSGKRFLLCKRVNPPAKGKWWLVGGRVIKGEILEKAVARKLREEIGAVKMKIKGILTSRETIFRNSAFPGVSSHTINSVFLAELAGGSQPLRLDSQSSRFGWFSKINPRWPSYVKTMLRLAGFR